MTVPELIEQLQNIPGDHSLRTIVFNIDGKAETPIDAGDLVELESSDVTGIVAYAETVTIYVAGGLC